MIIDDDDEKIVWPRKTTMRMIDADETHRLVQKKTYERHRTKKVVIENKNTRRPWQNNKNFVGVKKIK